MRWKLLGEVVLSNTSQITGTSHFTNDLGLDSLDVVEVVMAVEEVYSELIFAEGPYSRN